MISTVSKRFANIGFVGLGVMGGPMARNLALNGNHSLTVFDLSKNRTDWLKSQVQDLEVAESAAEVAMSCDVVVTMLTSNPQVKSAYMSDFGLLLKARKNSLFIDCSTIDPTVCREVAARAEAVGAKFLDAPVNGGIPEAKDGTLGFYVGHDDMNSFNRAQEVLEAMGKSVIAVDGVGNGQTAKVCNNMMLGISMIATAETMNMGMKLGMAKFR